MQDVAGNMVTLVDDNGVVKEWYLYDRQEAVTYFTSGGYYHAALGRLLPTGTISVLPESQLNSYAQEFPLGSYRPPPPTAMEELLRWAGEQSPWIKTGIGVAAMAFGN